MPNMAMHAAPTVAQVEEYREAGLLFPIDVLEPWEAARYRAEYRLVAALLGGNPKAVQLTQIHRFYRWAWELASHPRVLDAVEAVLGPDILAWSAQVFPKAAGDSGYISMHQDGTYWGLEGGQVVSAWIALTDSTVANGCMRVVPGSHRSGILPHTDTFAEDNLLTRGQEVQAECNEDDIVDIELKAGQMSLHHVQAIHGSNSNRSAEPRIGFVARYMTPQVQPLRPGQKAALVRGRDTCGNWELHQGPPRYASLRAATRAHAAEAERFVAQLTRD